MTRLAILLAAAFATPAVAAGEEYGFVSLRNTDFVVLLAFILFVAVLLWYGVPRRIAQMLDQRAEGIERELGEARALRDEAQALLASFEQKRREVSDQAARIVETAREEAQRAAAQAREDAARAVERRISSAEERIAAAEAKAVREVRDRAVTVAVATAREVLAQQMTAAQGDRLIDDSIATVGAKLH
jgi:F-type H+-transporting ATPase subunit b